MPSWDDFDNRDSNNTYDKQRELDVMIQELCAIHNRKRTDAAIHHMIQRLLPYGDESIKRAIAWAKDQKTFPSVAELIEVINSSDTASRMTYTPPLSLSEGQRKDSTESALRSMLWLHYNHGWPLSSFIGSSVFASIFRFNEIDDSQKIKSLEELKKTHTKESIDSWMKNFK